MIYTDMMTQPLTIVEGPDGAGKTTFAKAYAELTQARYVHCPPFHKVFNGLARLYFDMMLPAVLGYEPVVMDRSWLSEPIYGSVMRGGHDRVGPIFQRMLERVALRAGAVVVNCLPAWEVIQRHYRRQVRPEYVSDEGLMGDVYNEYDQLTMTTSLPVVHYDFEQHTVDGLGKVIHQMHLENGLHPVEFESAGKLSASLILLGDRFAEHKDKDSWYQYPFISWTKAGCSQWFTAQLMEAKLTEAQLLWLNVDGEYGEANLEAFVDAFTTAGARAMAYRVPTIIALGERAHSVATEYGIDHLHVPHPQYWKRFRVREVYQPLFDALCV